MTPKNEEKTNVNFRISKREFELFKKICQDNDLTASQVLRSHIKKTIKLGHQKELKL